MERITEERNSGSRPRLTIGKDSPHSRPSCPPGGGARRGASGRRSRPPASENRRPSSSCTSLGPSDNSGSPGGSFRNRADRDYSIYHHRQGQVQTMGEYGPFVVDDSQLTIVE